jgi:hypothetical protein
MRMRESLPAATARLCAICKDQASTQFRSMAGDLIRCKPAHQWDSQWWHPQAAQQAVKQAAPGVAQQGAYLAVHSKLPSLPMCFKQIQRNCQFRCQWQRT